VIRILGVLLLLFGIAFAQTKSKKVRKPETPQAERCGSECKCLRRTQKLQDEHGQECDRKFERKSKAWQQCFAKQPEHCDVASDRSGKYPYPYLPCEASDGGVYTDEETSNTTETGMMDVQCTVRCKKHDCHCDDGPVCKDVP